MKRLEDYVDAARSFNAGIKGDSTLAVVEKLGKDDKTTDYTFNDGVIISHCWDGGVYGLGYKDYDHDVDVINDAGYEFDKKSYNRHSSSSRRL